MRLTTKGRFAVTAMLDLALRQENCHSADHELGGRCMTHDLWSTLNSKMVEYLDSVSLQDLVDQQKQKAAERSVVIVHRTQAAI
jgi:Rrf2 family iron-sulfur cluster assembly transcriptional regulator